MFKSDPRGVLAWGPSAIKATAIAVDGGYRVTGTWPFASGSRHATWLAAHCRVLEPDGKPRHDANGNPVEKSLVVPRENATFSDVWHVIGLKGTGSDTYTFTDVFVPAERAISYHALDPAERREPGALYAYTIHQMFGSTFPAVALGIARAMLNAFVELAKAKTPIISTTLLRDNAVIQSQVGVAEAQLGAARAFFYQAWEESWRAAQSDTMSVDLRVRLRMASVHAAQEARKVAETAYLAAGATAIFASNPFERRFRDMHAVSQQLQAHFSIFEVIGRHYLGLPLNSRLI
jgi:alkylation response protein AidB-like acyl-CoA dehydrogenase